MPDWLAVVILGIIEGVTEFLPISSTGHLLMANHFLPIRSEFIRSDLFTVVIQPGAVLAVLVLFWRRVLDLLRRWREPDARDYLLKLGVAFGVTGFCGLVLKKLGLELPESLWPVVLATGIGGALFIVIEQWRAGKPAGTEITWAVVAAMAAGQLLAAVFPGASRSGSTILLALALGLGRKEATEFSFLLGIPTLLAAAAKESYDAVQDPPPFPIDWGLIALGAAVSAVTAFIAVKWLLRFVQSHTFIGFGWYRIGLALVLVAAFALRG
jgi:undecaprenyl-diphosphatase